MMVGDKAAAYQINSSPEEALKLNIDDIDPRNPDHDPEHEPSAVKEKASTSSNKQLLKYVSLVTLTFQNASLTLFMRAARTQKELFISSTAVIMSETLKLLTCLIMVYREEGYNVNRAWKVVQKTVVNDPMDTLKVAVPAIVYYVQNNLIYLAATHLDAATTQVTYQLKILTTALFSVFLLKKKLIVTQWLALVLLFVGVAAVQLTQTKKKTTASADEHPQNVLVGFLAILSACVLSGFAGVYFEKILKNSAHVSLWIRNIQLAAIAVPVGLVTLVASDHETITEKGFFFGYTLLTWTVIILQAQGGLLVAVVVKYADNILKGFATSISIIISCIVSIYVFDFVITFQFFIGASLVIASVFLYNRQASASHKK